MSCFSFAAFQILSLPLFFDNLIIMYLCVVLFTFILLKLFELLECVDLCILPNLGNFWPLFLQIFFLSLSFSTLHLGLTLCICWYAWLCTKVLLGSVHLSSHSLMISSTLSNLQLKSSCEFFIFSLWFLFIISKSLLIFSFYISYSWFDLLWQLI